MKGSAHSSGFVAGRWKASHAAISAAELTMLAVLKVGLGKEPEPAEERRRSAWAMRVFCVVVPSWMKMARLDVLCGWVRIATMAVPTVEVRIMLKGWLPPSMTVGRC